MARIVHISDLHFPSRDEAVAQELAETIVRLEPDVLVVTGDLANHPSLWWCFKKGSWIAARGWLESIRMKMPEGKLRIFVLPGNHDVLISGLSGWCQPSTLDFQKVFGKWFAPSVTYIPELQITFLTLDTNPLGARFSAQGKVNKWRLERMRKEMGKRSSEIRDSTKILLMHHHPLPVPFQGRDFLLDTKRVDRLLQFLAQNRIDLVLHGHKHRATWSHVRIGGANGEPFFIEVVGAGAAMKRTDYDPRGHNLNVLDITLDGTRQVRQFFRIDGGDRFADLPPSKAEVAMSRLVESEFRHPFQMKRYTWRVEADIEGDAKNHVIMEGLQFNRILEAYEVPLREDELEGGEALPYVLVEATPQTLGAALAVPTRYKDVASCVRFSKGPTRQTPGSVKVVNYHLNTYALNRVEAAQLGLSDTERDYVELELSMPVEELVLAVEFPGQFSFVDERMEVFDAKGAFHERLSGEVSGSIVKRSANCIEATLPLPSPTYKYRLSWAIPPAPQAPEVLKGAIARRTRFEKVYLGNLTEQQFGPISEAFQDLYSELENRVREATDASSEAPAFLEFDKMDLSLMVCDRSSDIPKLRLAYWKLQDLHQDVFREFRLRIGEGNAGRAYKTASLRLFDAEKAKGDPKSNTYYRLQSGPAHALLISVPLLDPESSLPLGVLSAGTTSREQAGLIAALFEKDFRELMEVMQEEPVSRLLDAAGLN